MKENNLLEEICKRSVPDNLARRYVLPVRIVWQSHDNAQHEHCGRLFQNCSMQPNHLQDKFSYLFKYDDKPTGILLDFGCELNGGIRIVTGDNMPRMGRLRIRFGESVSEAMGTPNNDHAIHDEVIKVPWHGCIEYGNTGFRFVRIDAFEKGTCVSLKQIYAVFVFRDLEYKGQFECSDTRLNKIWKTGAHTVHLNMQEYLWDGIKRDRLVWIGDMHPEVMTINSVFGFNRIVPDSLDLIRDRTPLPEWMNGIPSYSLWWILIQKEWYLYHGDMKYLEQQRDYLLGLIEELQKYINKDNQESLPEKRFLDWSIIQDKESLKGGLQALMILAFKAAGWLCTHMGESIYQNQCQKNVDRLLKGHTANTNKKQAIAMMSLANLIDSKKSNEILSQNPFDNLSTFFGYYILQARSLANDYNGALDVIRNYWGAMLDLGATTFWENFDITHKDSARIDQIPTNGQRDFHTEYGQGCYKSTRNSLCHGWASGPTAWLTEHILGFRPLEPGSKKLLIKPELSDLDWAKGLFPTPYGAVKVSHSKDKSGRIRTILEKPDSIEIIKNIC